ncbi:hypothetical protein [Streptomyces sp. NPDC088246]|uniref:hypothetical protein n=1 Tax=Streptomyces sp. NPDC088246 TaxID=3365842 RepID=UPI003828109D
MAKFEGHYHGFSDQGMVSSWFRFTGHKHAPEPIAGTHGSNTDVVENTVVLQYGGLERLREQYDARASCFTYLANKGVPDHLLARWAGHTDIRMTKRWYVKPDVEDLRPAADMWGELASAPAPAHEENVRCGSVRG